MPRRIELRGKIRGPIEPPMLEARVTLGLTQRQAEVLRRLAEVEHRSINHVIRSAIEAMIAAEQPDNTTLPDDKPTDK